MPIKLGGQHLVKDIEFTQSYERKKDFSNKVTPV